jgi:nucleoside-diphosphate-sugar epimerase
MVRNSVDHGIEMPEDRKKKNKEAQGTITISAKELAEEIRKELPNFNINYEPDFRQAIADSWPNSIDETHAQNDWNWKHTFDLKAIVRTMLDKVKIS